MTRRKTIALGATIIGLMLGLLFTMGRLPWCACGTIKLWYGVVVSSENSQHVFDWYSFTHVLHGLLIYAVLRLIDRKKRLSLRTRFLMALALEASWEVIENTNAVINHYRAATISLDYYGDSIVNSLGDLVAMSVGFMFASRARVWISVALFIAIELLLAWTIRDNLTLNIFMLLVPSDAVRSWQQG